MNNFQKTDSEQGSNETKDIITLHDIEEALTNAPWEYDPDELPLIGKNLDSFSFPGLLEYVEIKDLEHPSDEFIIKMSYGILNRNEQGLHCSYKWDKTLNHYKLGRLITYGFSVFELIDNGIKYFLDSPNEDVQIVVPRWPSIEQMHKCLSSPNPSLLAENSFY